MIQNGQQSLIYFLRCETRPGSQYVLRSYTFYSASATKDTTPYHKPYLSTNTGSHFPVGQKFQVSNGYHRDVNPSGESGLPLGDGVANRGGAKLPNFQRRSRSGTFILRLYQYADPFCTTPLYTFTARGTFGSLRQSWTVPGGTEMEYILRR